MDRVFLIRHRGADGAEQSLGFCSTMARAMAAIEVHRWQPAYKDYAGGFDIETFELDKKVSFRNGGNEPLELVIEPWASTELIPPGSTVDILYPSPLGREDASRAEHLAGAIIFWCDGPTYELNIDGARIET